MVSQRSNCLSVTRMQRENKLRTVRGWQHANAADWVRKRRHDTKFASVLITRGQMPEGNTRVQTAEKTHACNLHGWKPWTHKTQLDRIGIARMRVYVEPLCATIMHMNYAKHLKEGRTLAVHQYQLARAVWGQHEKWEGMRRGGHETSRPHCASSRCVCSLCCQNMSLCTAKTCQYVLPKHVCMCC